MIKLSLLNGAGGVYSVGDNSGVGQILVWVAWVHKIGVGGVGRDFGVGDMGP